MVIGLGPKLPGGLVPAPATLIALEPGRLIFQNGPSLPCPLDRVGSVAACSSSGAQSEQNMVTGVLAWSSVAAGGMALRLTIAGACPAIAAVQGGLEPDPCHGTPGGSRWQQRRLPEATRQLSAVGASVMLAKWGL